MDNIFLRHFIIFVTTLLISVGTLCYVFISGDIKIKEIYSRVDHAHEVITEAESIIMNVESALAAQRGFLLTGDESFMQEYETRKSYISENMAILAELTKDNLSQQSRMEEMRDYVSRFISKIDVRARIFGAQMDKTFLDDIETINFLRNNILRIGQAILNEEYSLLNNQITAVDIKRQNYQLMLILALCAGSALLIFLNAALFMLQRKRNKAESSLRESKNRFVMAVEGTQDGIFDWDLKKDEIFYSRRVFEMLGYDRKSFTGKIDDFTALIHPDDIDRVMEYIERFIEGEVSDYTIEFRAKHASGRWVWLQSRAKGDYDENGRVVRMVGAHSDITHIKQVQVRLENEKKQAEEANRAKSEFLAHMSHEIRTPLTAISGIAEILKKHEETLDEKQRQLVSTLVSSSAALKDLINDILDFSKIEGGDVELEENAFILGDLFEEVLGMMNLRAMEKGISFIGDYKKIENIEYVGDRMRLRQILVNLIGNAVKFTDEGGVTIKGDIEKRENSSFLRIDITDTGIGISEENFDVVFERFKQADASVSRRYGGTGLGLPISRNLANLMGGEILLSSEAGKGSTFTVLIPYDEEDGQEGAQKKKQKLGKIGEKIFQIAPDERKVLLVEDYSGNVVLISYILDDLNIDYDVANTGEEALNLWNKSHYNLVLMDVQMPEMDGFTATKEIRKIEQAQGLKRTPIIGMTAHALVGDRDKCIEAGMDSYLAKPIVGDDLKEEIWKFLAHSRKKSKKASS